MIEFAIATLSLSFFILLALGIPVSFSIIFASFLSLVVHFPSEIASKVVAQKMMTALDSFGLLAIPFFILAGNIMNQGGIALRLIEFAKLVGGRLPGALAHCNILANMLFGAISGSAVSSVAAVGGIMGPIQKKEGYDPHFSAAVNIASGPSGLIIPPSGSLILYSLASGGTSVAALFMAGYIPGLLQGLGLMFVAGFISKRNGYPLAPKRTLREAFEITLAAVPSFLLVFIVIGGIIAGIFTATEASAIAVIYALILSVFYREISFVDLKEILEKTVVTTSIVLFLVGASTGMSWAMASADIPNLIANTLTSFTDSKILLLLILNIIILVVGTFMDITPALLIFTPIFLPVVTKIGIDPVHFGIMLVFNLCIGICTPPVGSALFVGCSIAKVPLTSVIKHLIPMYLVLFVVLLLLTYIPELSLWLPTAFEVN